MQQALTSAASKTELATSSQQWSLEHAKGENTRQLTACQRLVTAYAATKCAREWLQACLEQESNVLNELHDPVHLCLQQSAEILHTTADQLRGDDPQREHTEMLIRYVFQFVVAVHASVSPDDQLALKISATISITKAALVAMQCMVRFSSMLTWQLQSCLGSELARLFAEMSRSSKLRPLYRSCRR